MPLEAKSSSPIYKSKILLVEGDDDFRFFTALCKHLRLTESIEIRDFKGAEKLPGYLEVFSKTAGFHQLVALGIVRDADEDASSAFASVCNALQRSGFFVPPSYSVFAGEKPKIGVYLLPDCQRPGELETLLLDSVREDPAMLCVDEYFACLKRQKPQQLFQTDLRYESNLNSQNISTELRKEFGNYTKKPSAKATCVVQEPGKKWRIQDIDTREFTLFKEGDALVIYEVPLPRNMDKARLQTFLASRSKAGLRLGEAAEAGHWPWDHPVFTGLKSFLDNLTRRITNE